MVTANDQTSGKIGWGLEWWYNAHFTFGVIQNVFVPILIPTFVLEMTGKAAMAGVLMAIIGLAGLVAPVMGGLADKFRAHRLTQLIALMAYAVGGILFAFAGETTILYYAAAACIGIGSATLMMINPVFIVSAGFSQESESVRLARLNQTLIVGQLVAGLGLGALTTAGLSYPARFLVMSGIAVISFVLTAFTNREPAARIKTEATVGDPKEKGKVDIKTILISTFGIFLLAVLFGQIANTTLSGQYPNYMQKVFSIDSSISSLGLSASSIVTLVVLSLVGRWMSRSGPAPIWLTCMVTFLGSAVALILLALVSKSMTAVLPLACYVIYAQAMSAQDMVQPALAARVSTAPAATTQGYLLFIVASSYAFSSIVAGEAADLFGFGILTWIVSAGAIVAFFIGRIAISRMRSETESGCGP